MSDDDTLEPDGVDARDERLARALAVPPLDDVTRRSLVRDALEQATQGKARRPPPRYAAMVSVAAALAVGAVIGWALVKQPDETSTTTVQRGPSVTQALGATSSTSAVAPAAGDAAGPITALGDLGDVTDPAHLRTQVSRGFTKSAGPEDQSAVAAVPCVSTPPRSVDLVALTAVGTGTYQGTPATVLVGTSPEGKALAVVVRQPECTLLASVTLPSR
jgi:hypothetical protein